MVEVVPRAPPYWVVEGLQSALVRMMHEILEALTSAKHCGYVLSRKRWRIEVAWWSSQVTCNEF